VGDFNNSSRLRRDLVLRVFESLSNGESLLETLIEIRDVSSMLSFLEGLVQFPIMPKNFATLECELNDTAKEEISKFQMMKVEFFEAVVKKYTDGELDAVPLDLIDMLWLLIDEGNLSELIELLPEGTKERQAKNFLDIDVSDLDDNKRNEILRFRELYDA